MPNVEPTPPLLLDLPCRFVSPWWNERVPCGAQPGEPCTDNGDKCHNERWDDRYASPAWADYLAAWAAWQDAARPTIEGVKGQRRASVLANLAWLANQQRDAGEVPNGWAVWYLAEFEAGNGGAWSDAATADRPYKVRPPTLASQSLREVVRRTVVSLVRDGLIEDDGDRSRANAGRYVRVPLTEDEAARDAEERREGERRRNVTLAALGAKGLCRKCGEPAHPGLRFCLDHAAEQVAPSLAFDALPDSDRDAWVAKARERLIADAENEDGD